VYGAVQHVCGNCFRPFSATPLYGQDVGYCCAPCLSRHLCTCLTEVDLASDGVDGLGLPFGSAVREEALAGSAR
jgi:hypothetical protein